MRRSLLLSVSVLGLLICVIGGSGLFAALSDSAHTGTNTVDSAALPSSSDLQLATAGSDASGFTCGTFSDHLATGLFTVNGMTVSTGANARLCIRNIGSAPVSLTGVVDQLTDVDTACTGDEADYGDVTCGGDQAGELAAVVETTITEYTCVGPPVAVAAYGPGILEEATEPGPIGSLGANQTKCYILDVAYGVSAGTTPRQLSQSDRVTWRYVFTGQAASS